MPRERDSDDALTTTGPQDPPEPPDPPRGRIRRALAAALGQLRRHRRILLLFFLCLTGLWLSWTVFTWPDVAGLRQSNPQSTAFIDRYLERTGRSAAAWTWVPSSRISPHLKEAVVVAEDLEFFSHEGFSTHEIKAAIREAVKEREAPRGASTITQQLAKNLWLSPSRDPLRKGKEVILTKQLERHLGKERILELYLNVVEFGPGVYGAEAAARHYYGKPASAIGPREAAMLAAALPRPSQWHPGVESRGYARRVETLLARMRQVTFLDRRFGIAPPAPQARPPHEEIPADAGDPGAAEKIEPYVPVDTATKQAPIPR